MQILIATSRFQDLAGSEITVLEYAIELSLQGNAVSIACFFESERYKDECIKHGIKLATFDDSALINTSWDVIWIFHQPTFYALFSKWNYSTQYTIFSSLSHFEPLETPPIEICPLNIITTNSEENLSYFNENYPDYSSKAIVLPNSIPRDFWVNQRSVNSGKVLIVSNHIPSELLELKDILESQGTIVDIYGTGYIEDRITPQVLSNYKLCISIGKTVQYCLALKVPVFCYDHFGGPGWITEENIITAADKNFSGRCSPSTYTAEELSKKIEDELIPSVAELEQNFQFAKDKFSLDKNLSGVLDALSRSVISLSHTTTATEKKIFSRIVDVFLRDSRRQHELSLAYQKESQRREKAELQLCEYKYAWEAESAKRFSVEDELLKIASALEIERKEHVEAMQQLIDAKKSKLLKSYYFIKSLAKKFNIKK